MTSSNAAIRYRSSCAFWIVLLMGAMMLLFVAGATLAMSPSLVTRPAAAPITETPLSWALVNLAKPTYTPSPAPTSTPEPSPTSEPTQSLIQVEIVPQDAGSANPISSPTGKYIQVSISDQHLFAYDNGQLVYSFVASTGMRHSTRVGTFSVLDKIPNAYGSTWNIWMPDWMGIYYSGTLENGIHALPILADGSRLWAGFLGTPISFGCVVLGTDDADLLYNWADIGTPVEIQY